MPARDRRNPQQVFAQLKTEFAAGAVWHLDADEERQLEEINQQHRHYGIIGEKVKASLDLTRKGRTDNPRDSAGDVLRKISIERPTNPQYKEANAILRELLGPPKKIQGIYRWYVPWDRTQPTTRDLKSNPDDEYYG
jgi:hypothetical protein